MRDKRPVDELSVEELERILAIKKREERQQKMKRMRQTGRMVDDSVTPPSPAAPQSTSPKQHPPQSAIFKTANNTSEGSAQVNTLRYDAAPQFEDTPEVEHTPDRAAGRFARRLLNQLLLLVEVAAVIGLVYLGYQMFNSIGKLEEETANAQRMADEQRLASLPTVAPTPMLRLEEVVLPGGHTPPTAPGGAQFNLNEIPAGLLPAVQSQLFQPVIARPPQTDETPLRLIIPKLELDQTIVQGTDWEALKQGVGQLQNGANPGDEQGNVVFAAHNDIYGELFRHLDQLEPGDQFQIQTRARSYTYIVSGWDLYEPTDVHVMDNRGGATVTLISCYPYQVNNKRIVVFAEQVDT
jgi:sortase A